MQRKGFTVTSEVTVTKEAVWETVRKMREENILDSDEHERACRFLLLGMSFGTDADIIGKLAGCTRTEARKFAARCYENKIWVRTGREGGKTDCNWFDKADGVMALVLDTLVVVGQLQCVEGPQKLAPCGKAGVSTSTKGGIPHGNEESSEEARQEEGGQEDCQEGSEEVKGT